MKDKSYLIFGNGWIGNKFKDFYENLGESVFLVKDRIDTFSAFTEIFNQIENYNPDVVINCIGKTGKPNIDWCESHKEETFFSNVTVPAIMADACKELNKYMVHIGSGCIYESKYYYDTENSGSESGNSYRNGCFTSIIGFSEIDKPNFKGSFYSRTKIYAEKILSEYDDVLQLRIRMPIDNVPSERNLINKLIKYKQVINIPNSITYIPDMLVIANKLIDIHETGIYNVTNPGVITQKEILKMYKNIVDFSYVMPEFIGLEKLKELTVAGRSNCILYNAKLAGKMIEMRNVQNAVRECMLTYNKNKKLIRER